MSLDDTDVLDRVLSVYDATFHGPMNPEYVKCKFLAGLSCPAGLPNTAIAESQLKNDTFILRNNSISVKQGYVGSCSPDDSHIDPFSWHILSNFSMYKHQMIFWRRT